MIIFINGSINSGKSTISKLLQKDLENTAIVEIDTLRAFIEWMPLKEAIPINLKNTVSVIKNFISKEMNVIVPYPLSKENHQYFMKNLESLTKLYFVTLSPDIVNVLKNKGNRSLDDWEVNRIKYHYKIGINNPDFGKIIDNSNQTPEETTEIISEYIRNN